MEIDKAIKILEQIYIGFNIAVLNRCVGTDNWTFKKILYYEECFNKLNDILNKCKEDKQK